MISLGGGGTEEIVDGPRGRKATVSGRVREGDICAPSRVKRGSKELFVPNTQ